MWKTCKIWERLWNMWKIAKSCEICEKLQVLQRFFAGVLGLNGLKTQLRRLCWWIVDKKEQPPLRRRQTVWIFWMGVNEDVRCKTGGDVTASALKERVVEATCRRCMLKLLKNVRLLRTSELSTSSSKTCEIHVVIKDVWNSRRHQLRTSGKKNFSPPTLLTEVSITKQSAKCDTFLFTGFVQKYSQS